MKTIFIFFALTALFGQEQTTRRLFGSWTMVCYDDIKSGESDCESVRKQTYPIVVKFKRNGKVTGHTSRNEFIADYATLDKKIKIGTIISTKAGERTRWGSNFYSSFSRSTSYSFKKDTLIILYEDDKKAMKFVKSSIINIL